MNPAEDEVDEFELVVHLEDRQLAQLGLLRMYIVLATGVAIPNDLFLYKEQEVKELISDKAIGLHESLFDGEF